MFMAEAGTGEDLLGNGFLSCMHSLMEMCCQKKGLPDVGSRMQLSLYPADKAALIPHLSLKYLLCLH